LRARTRGPGYTGSTKRLSDVRVSRSAKAGSRVSPIKALCLFQRWPRLPVPLAELHASRFRSHSIVSTLRSTALLNVHPTYFHHCYAASFNTRQSAFSLLSSSRECAPPSSIRQLCHRPSSTFSSPAFLAHPRQPLSGSAINKLSDHLWEGKSPRPQQPSKSFYC